MYDEYYNITSGSKTITIDGLTPATDYTINVGYNTTGVNTVTWIGAKTFITSTAYIAKLYFSPNGGSGGPGTVSFYGASSRVSCSIPTTIPTRSNYTFLGWSTSSSATTPSYYAGSTYTFTGSTSGTTHRLYAVWEERKLYARINYNANGGSSAPSATNVSYATNATSVNLSIAITTAIPTRSNYVFLGWSKSSTATSPSYSPGDKITIQATSTNSSNPTTVTLYAVWTRAYYAKIVYNANGGTGAPSSQTFAGTSANVEVTLSEVEPTKAGAVFLGWAIISDATEPKYFGGENYFFTGSTNTTTTTLYAVWMQDDYRVAITFITDNGESYTDYFIGSEPDVPVTMPTLSAEGLVFLGWSTTIPASTATYLPGKTYNFTGGVNSYQNYTLYAVWGALFYVKVTFDSNGGSGAPDSITASGTESNVSVRFPSEIPVRDGYTFLGWAYSSTATSPSYYAGGVYELEGSTIKKEYTFYAVWLRSTRYGGVWINGKYYIPWIYTNGWRKYAAYIYTYGWKKTRD